jgi:peptidoglycan/LPS O-acetylase OafA/YrhL
MEATPAAGRIRGIEALRAVAIAWVLLFHWLVARDPQSGDPWVAAITGWAPANAFLRNGFLGVDLFFLISGFLLVLPWARAAAGEGKRPDTRAFYARRIRRIVPAYYAQLLLLFALFAPLLLGRGYVRDWGGGLVALNAATHATFLHYTTPLTSASFGVNGALWSLAIEMQFYLLLPALAPAFARRPLAWGLALIAAAGAWRWLAAHDLGPLVAAERAIAARFEVGEGPIRHLLGTQLPAYFAHFAVGMAAGCAWSKWVRERGRDFRQGPAVLASGALAVLYGACAVGEAGLGLLGWWLVSLACLAALLVAFALPGPFSRAVSQVPVLFVGRVSYSIYLYQLPLLYLWNRFRVLDGSAASMPAFVAVVLIVAWVSYAAIERPFIARGRHPAPSIIAA